jgi:pyruvate/2-oxoglutarate dehydrogenase complex dihydrolipoamide dehydrogenase (E3) component
VVGSGSGGRGVAKRLAADGMSVALVESELVGGECPYWACMPAKTLLRPPEAVASANHVPGVTARIDRWDEVVAFRDGITAGGDDARKSAQLRDKGITILRGHGRLAGPGVVEVDGAPHRSPRVVIATGSTTALPPIEGLDAIEAWTNREAMSFTEVPESAAILGGGPVGIEIGQMLARYGSVVHIVESGERLLAREEPEVGDMVAAALAAEGIDVRVGVEATAVAPRPGERIELSLADGARVEAARLIVATGRRPRVEGIGLETVGIVPGEKGIPVDERCRAAEGVWAVGDVTGLGQFTHVAAYQARVVCGDIQGKAVRADYRAVPRVVFCDPEVAAVGMTAAQAAEAGIATAAARVDLADVERSSTYGADIGGVAGVLADTERGVLIGAHAVGPLASEWIHMAVLAVRAEVPVEVLRDTIGQFPTFSESLITAARDLEL